jgi:hypothetical protein
VFIDSSQTRLPVFRRLRVFAVDPGLLAKHSTAHLNDVTLLVPWEPLRKGPAGEYVAVVDRDEQNTLINEPVDLEEPALIAMDGLAPSDGNPQFRHQMLYAVAMQSIQTFERALGRPVQWPSRKSGKKANAYVRTLELRPHFMNDANAYYNPESGLFCFGYFVSESGSRYAGTAVFTCLSRDVIAHELTHAILPGMHLEAVELTEGDVYAFHEGFADLFALLHHFSNSPTAQAEIAAIGGDFTLPNTLGAVAPQFARALGMHDGLRNAFGSTETGVWRAHEPDPKLYQTVNEPHNRGHILVIAVLRAFRTLFEARTEDLKRMAARGASVGQKDDLHPDLVNRLAQEASEVAESVLNVCIRALDYLPPVEITFGDFLRAIVTADHDVFPVDRRHFRVAVVEAFRSYGIVPGDVGTFSIDTLLWDPPANSRSMRLMAEAAAETIRDVSWWNVPQDREKLWRLFNELRASMAKALRRIGGRIGELDLSKPFKVETFDLSWRAVPGELVTAQWVVRITQEYGPKQGKRPVSKRVRGCTILIDAATRQVKYFIEKHSSMHYSSRRNLEVALKRKAAGVVKPTERRLRVFAFDPTLGTQLDTARINEVTLSVPWEPPGNDAGCLTPGPSGEYVEVVDRDPSSNCFYAPVDLNEQYLLAQNGLDPSESNPQFHQQMVYAVAMRTIQTFERALGRRALWSPRLKRGERGRVDEEYVPKLRIYPHALREANAYYSPEKKALLFGYFPVRATAGSSVAQLTVFTCLSHDIIAHETTHALLDGMHGRFSEASNPDVLAFHEAFADIVALFLHFSMPEVLAHQIAATRGDLASQSRLGELAQQFGQAIGKRGALRSAIGQVDENDRWTPIDPDPDRLNHVSEPHERGAILVAAVFDAFLTIYRARIADLLRIASEGTGILPAGSLHPDLVRRMSDEAAGASQAVLEMCIRALDYCPPVDVTFGDYLRALVTADAELDPVDSGQRRVAFVEAFRRYGIVPEDVRTLSLDGLLWRPTSAAPDEDEKVVLDHVVEWAADMAAWGLTHSRESLYELMRDKRRSLHQYLKKRFKDGARISGIDQNLRFEVHSIRPTMRSDALGRPQFQWIVEITQRIGQYLDPADEARKARPDYYFRGGCTLVIDGRTGKVRYSIRKRLDDRRRKQQQEYLTGSGNESLAATYFGGAGAEDDEPFAMLHRS